MVKGTKRQINYENAVEPNKKKTKLEKQVFQNDKDITNKTGKSDGIKKINKIVSRKNGIPVKSKKAKKTIKDLVKISTAKDNNERLQKKKDIINITKNQCVCDAADEEPAQSQLLEDHEAHMLVEEWRLHKFQSPIELRHDESISHDHFEPLEFHGHWDKIGEATFANTGKTALLRFQKREAPYLIGGPLHEDTYIFEQLHFHWSDDDEAGCEHIFEGLAYSMEVHAVHYNKKYSSFEEAQDKPDGLAVIGFFLEATDNEDNPCFNKLTMAVHDIIKVGTTTNVAADCLTWIKEEAQCKGYYTYQGSLTTEPYLESVTWILYPTPIHVSRQQVASFRELKSCPCERVNIVNNVRPIQTPPPDKKLNILFARSHRKSE